VTGTHYYIVAAAVSPLHRVLETMVSSSSSLEKEGTRSKGVFGLAFKVLLLLKKPKAKPNNPAFSQFHLEKLFFCSLILKASWKVLLLAFL
jgi:hypothetical protein